MANKPRISHSEASAFGLNIALLLAANVLTIYFFAVQHSSVWQVLLTYYIQTIGLVYFYYRRIIIANATEVNNDLWAADETTKLGAVWAKTTREQFAYIFIFGVPLALILFVAIESHAGNSLLGSIPFKAASIDYWSVGIASLLFLAHHSISYAIHVWQYRAGRIRYIRIPYLRLAVRVTTVVAVVLAAPLAVKHGRTDTLFYVFMAAKTLLDIVFSGSYYLANDLRGSN